MTPAETTFKNIVAEIIREGNYPSPRRINIKLVQKRCIDKNQPCYCKNDLLNYVISIYPTQYFDQDGNLYKCYNHSFNNLSGRQCRWRREICAQLSYKLKGYNLGDKNHRCNDIMCKGNRHLNYVIDNDFHIPSCKSITEHYARLTKSDMI